MKTSSKSWRSFFSPQKAADGNCKRRTSATKGKYQNWRSSWVQGWRKWESTRVSVASWSRITPASFRTTSISWQNSMRTSKSKWISGPKRLASSSTWRSSKNDWRSMRMSWTIENKLMSQLIRLDMSSTLCKVGMRNYRKGRSILRTRSGTETWRSRKVKNN